jgi:hypothetical protein
MLGFNPLLRARLPGAAYAATRVHYFYWWRGGNLAARRPRSAEHITSTHRRLAGRLNAG